MNVSVAPSAERDIGRHYERLERLAAEGIASAGRHDIWFRQLEDAIEALAINAHQHGFAYERHAWGRDVRLALFAAGYRLRRPDPGSAYRHSQR